MKPTLRTYGTPPFDVVVLHGGPGAAGGLMPLAKAISKRHGVLEPLQRASSIAGQLRELETVLKTAAHLPVTLIGHSWGAWLGYLFAAECTGLIKKLIMVSSGGFDEKYAVVTQETRFSRLSEQDGKEAAQLLKIFAGRSTASRNRDFARLAELFFKVDAYDPLPQPELDVEVDINIYKRVWKEATALRRSGKLLEMGKKINICVVAIHGDYDSHPYEAVQLPLSGVLENFRFILLRNCGHKPWIERQARATFFDKIERELLSS